MKDAKTTVIGSPKFAYRKVDQISQVIRFSKLHVPLTAPLAVSIVSL